MFFLRFQRTLCSVLVALPLLALVVAPAKAQVPASFAISASTPNAADTPTAAPNPNPTPAIPGGNVTALLGVLVMKGVLTPVEARSIESAPAGTEFQNLVNALTRKGVVSASDLVPAAPVGFAPPTVTPAPLSASAAPPAAAPPAAAPAAAPSGQAAMPAAAPAPAPAATAAVVPPLPRCACCPSTRHSKTV